MKILIDARLYGLENAGLGRYIINLIDGLSKIDKNNEYVVLLLKKYFDNLELPPNWKKILADFRHYSFAEQIKLTGIIKKENPDITHFPHFNVPITFSGRYIVTIHDLLMHQNFGLAATTLSPPVYLFKRLGYKTIFRKAVTGAVKIITPSLAVKKEVMGYYHITPEKIKVIYEGVDEKISSIKDVRAKYNLKNPYFVYAGNAYPHKNLKRLIKAVTHMNKNINQKVDLVIASARNIFTHRLQNEVEKLGANGFIKLLGFIPDNELGSLYKNSLGFIFPSVSEGFGLPGLEAMSAGTLVAASDIPVFREIYKDNAIYFDPYDVKSIEAVMHKVIEIGSEERIKRVKKGKILASQYSWTKMAEETLSLYDQSLAK